MSDSPRNPAVEVLIEIPRGSRNKYEMDKQRGMIKLDRRLFTATVYPADYGYILDTLGEDGDPLDALVLLDDPTFPGCLVDAVPVGMLWMQDEKGPDAKVICVPQYEPRWEKASDLRDLPEQLLEEIKHFFDVYKELEPGKESSTAGFEGRKAAWKEIEAARARYLEPGH
jgi:inorganic pyrophosphatase